MVDESVSLGLSSLNTTTGTIESLTQVDRLHENLTNYAEMDVVNEGDGLLVDLAVSAHAMVAAETLADVDAPTQPWGIFMLA